MSTGLKKAWPYVIVLVLLGAVAVLTEDYLPFDLFGNNEEVEDSVATEIDSVQVEEVVPMDTTVLDTIVEEVIPEVIEVEEEAVKEWCLVIASVPSRDHAERIATKAGENAKVKYVEYLDTYRVVYNRYSSLAEAQNGFDEVSHQYPKAWLVYF